MLTIGLTGPSGSGKGHLASLFAAYGIPAIDTDAVYHALLVPPSTCLNELTDRFGSAILNPDGTLNRPALAAVVFAPGADEALSDLEHITHRHVLAEVRRLCAALATSNAPAVLVDAPRLYESGFDRECDVVVAVLATRDTRLTRIMTRDGLDAVRAAARLDAQKPDDFFADRADVVIWNDPADSHMVGKADRAGCAVEGLETRRNVQNHRKRDRGKTVENRGSTVPQNPPISAKPTDLTLVGDLNAIVRYLLADWGIDHEI